MTSARRSSAGTVPVRRPRPGPSRAAADPAQRAPAPAKRRSSRLLIAVLALLALAVAVVAIVILTAPATDKVILRNVVYSDVQQASSALQKLVSENTQ